MLRNSNIFSYNIKAIPAYSCFSYAQNTEDAVKENAQQDPSFEEVAMTTLSNHLAPAKSSVIDPLQKASHLVGLIYQF